MRILGSALLLPLLALGCAASPPAAAPRAVPSTRPARRTPPRRGLVREGTPLSVDLAAARARGGEAGFEWVSFSPETFARAKREGRFILLDGAAAWCHWCHVMDETTYVDPEVGRILRERFVAIRVDIDERPDLAERYGAWGWPATIVFTPDAREIGKYRGYLPPEKLLGILRRIEQGASVGAAIAAEEKRPAAPEDRPAPVEALGWIGARAALDMDDYFDRKEGGWGRRQKAPLGANVEFELVRAAHGDKAALGRAILSLKKQRALLDPVWGGIYQYSVGSTWGDPHFEKLMTYQAANLTAYARGYAATGDASLLEDARGIARYLDTFLSNADGAFLVSQDADVGAHDRSRPFVDGHVYYKLDDAGRRALGLPRVDESVYGYENGLAIAAMCALYEASREPSHTASAPPRLASALVRARRAADLLLRTHVAQDGAVRRPGRGAAGARYLADHAGLGFGLARLAEATGEAGYREAAIRIAGAMQRDLLDPETGAFFAATPDPAAAGVFARRERPLIHNVLVVRFYAALWRLTGDAAWRDRGRRTLAAVASPRALAEQGRMVGELLLAIEEVGTYPW